MTRFRVIPCPLRNSPILKAYCSEGWQNLCTASALATRTWCAFAPAHVYIARASAAVAASAASYLPPDCKEKYI